MCDCFQLTTREPEYDPAGDNFYCPVCGEGQGQAYFAAARKRDELHNEIAALKDALESLKDFVEGKRSDCENISQILNGALKIKPLATTTTNAELVAKYDSERERAGLMLQAVELRKAVAFFASVIKSGENWTTHTQQTFDRVMSETPEKSLANVLRHLEKLGVEFLQAMDRTCEWTRQTNSTETTACKNVVPVSIEHYGVKFCPFCAGKIIFK